jgi:hypothetical protein
MKEGQGEQGSEISGYTDEQIKPKGEENSEVFGKLEKLGD